MIKTISYTQRVISELTVGLRNKAERQMMDGRRKWCF